MHDLAIESAVEDVIRQFSDPLAFLRELVQNAIDAGTGEVEVRFDYNPEDGLGTVTVRDWGEGMSREIIEQRLVKLFNSSKDQDFTKIGKFGIGFVSVFAVEPEVVCIDTGRDGEYWRLLFHPDRSYELYSLDEPVEGTAVRVIMKRDRDDFDAFRKAGTERLRRWCAFVSVAVYVDEEDVRQPFELDGLVSVSFEEEGSRGVASLRPSPVGRGQYFNAGMLLQDISSSWPHIGFMLDSRYLEHTLTRDRVLEDKNFHTAVERLHRLVNEDLRAATEEALASWAQPGGRLWDWNRLCEMSVVAFDSSTWEQARFPTVRGELVDGAGCRSARNANRLMVTRGRAHFAHAMPDDYVLIDVRPDSGGAKLLGAVVQRDIPVLEDVWIQVPIVEAQSTGAEQLLDNLWALLREIGGNVIAVSFGEFDYAYSGVEGRAFLCLDDPRSPTHRGSTSAFDPFTSAGHLLVNVEHPAVDDAVAVSQVEPEWAAYTLLKAAALATEAVELGALDEATDVQLAMFCMDRRERRLQR